MLKVTEAAAKEINVIIAEQEMQPEDTFLRLGVAGGGCSGFNYTLDLTTDKKENDEQYEVHGIKIICDPKSHIYLDGTTVDFKNDSMLGKGFVFDNPQSTGSCGCGSSFSA